MFSNNKVSAILLHPALAIATRHSTPAPRSQRTTCAHGLPVAVLLVLVAGLGLSALGDVALAAPMVIDDQTAGWSVIAGNFGNDNSWGSTFNTSQSFNQSQTTADMAAYDFTGLSGSPYYDVYATWKQGGQSNAGNAVYSISDGGGTATVNQHTSAGGPASHLVIADTDGNGTENFKFQRIGGVWRPDGDIQVTIQSEGNNYVLSDAVAIEAVPARIIDDLGPGFSITGGWGGGGEGGNAFENHIAYINDGGTGEAVWTFDNLPAATYDVFATWSPHGNRSTEAPFTLSDGGGTVLVDQEQTPTADLVLADHDPQEFNFLKLGQVFVGDGEFTVTLTDDSSDMNANPNSYVIADAVAIQMIVPEPGTAGLLLLGLSALLLGRRARRR